MCREITIVVCLEKICRVGDLYLPGSHNGRRINQPEKKASEKVLIRRRASACACASHQNKRINYVRIRQASTRIHRGPHPPRLGGRKRRLIWNFDWAEGSAEGVG